MRGFPLIGALAMAMAFLLAWWPLQRLLSTDARDEAADTPAPVMTVEAPSAEPEADSLSLRIYATAGIDRLRVEHLGQVVVDRERIPEPETTAPLPGLVLPPEGVEFWVEASLSPAPGASPRAALAVELISDGHEPLRRTLWTDDAGGIADTVVFHPDATDQP
ncbi:MAG: hypothetical protein JNK37_07615 [Verrucomicrobiales bacterium]|nr:hypothetical protein [Verrucomicrobiales bacterium]